jgi:hypothetical protein
MSDIARQKVPQNRSRQRAASNRRMVSNNEAKWRPREILRNWLVDGRPEKSQYRRKPGKMFSANRKRLVITI